MKQAKVHYREPSDAGKQYFPRCGNAGLGTTQVELVTCDACRRYILLDVAPWVRDFLNDLRGKPGARKANAVTVPAGLPTQVDGKVKGLGDGFRRAFSQQCDAQEIVRVLLAVDTPGHGPVQPVMDDGRPPADAVGVKEREVTE